jgi:ribosomal protein S1
LTVTFGNLVGYIHKDHLVDINDKTSAYEKSSNHTAVVLYTLPLVNAVYLSLKSSLINPVLKRDEIDPICLGQFFEGTITDSTSAGLFMQLNEKVRGFVPLRHLSDKLDIFEDMRIMFPVKSQKRCRVLHYASLDDIYICTMKK